MEYKGYIIRKGENNKYVGQLYELVKDNEVIFIAPKRKSLKNIVDIIDMFKELGLL